MARHPARAVTAQHRPGLGVAGAASSQSVWIRHPLSTKRLPLPTFTTHHDQLQQKRAEPIRKALKGPRLFIAPTEAAVW